MFDFFRKMGHCCASLAKYLLCLANFVFFVVRANINTLVFTKKLVNVCSAYCGNARGRRGSPRGRARAEAPVGRWGGGSYN